MKKKRAAKVPVPPFAVGDRVVSDFVEREERVRRRVTRVRRDPGLESGWAAAADDGVCSMCRRSGTPIPMIDVAWFRRVKA